MTDDEIYLFDLTGFLVVKEVLSPEEVAQANAAIDHHADQSSYRSAELSLSGTSATLRSAHGRTELNGMLGWERPWCEPFRKMLVHPRIAGYLNVILGSGFRFDHGPGLIGADEGAEGHVLHSASGPGFDPTEYYIVRDGTMHNGLTVVSWQLMDVNEGDGGLCVMPGSHKGNFSCPASMRNFEQYQEFVHQITAKAGDVVIFTEALTHGTLPWRSKRPRRSILFKLSPASSAYSGGYQNWSTDAGLADLTEAQRGVLEPPYRHGNRPSLDP